MFTFFVLWRGITRNDRGSPGCSCRRGVTRPHSCSLARYGRQTKSVVLCISEKKIAPPSEPQGLTRELRPPHPLLIPSLRRTHGSETSKEPWVQLQWTSGLIKVQPMHPGLSNSFHMAGTPPTTSMALWWDTPPRKRGLTRTFCRCVSRPASYQPPPQMYNIQLLPTNVLERHQRSISRRHE